MTVDALFFDLDGTLVDSNDFHVDAWIEAFRDAGHEFDRQVIHDQIGKGADNLVPTLLPGTTEDEHEALGEAHGKIFKSRYLDQVRPFTGARDLLIRAHEAGQHIVFASSASQEELDHYIDLLDARDLVAAGTSIDDVENSKPAPDIFAVALTKIAQTDPARVMVIGDTPYDMQAAGKCGIRAIGVRSGKFPDQALREAGALTVYDDVAALLAQYDASPLAR